MEKFCIRIDVHGDEQVRLGLVGDVRPVAQRHVTVVGAREDDLDVRICRPNLVRQGLGDVQGQRLLVGLLVLAHCPGVLAAVAGINDNRGQPEIVSSRMGHAKKHGEEQADCAFQKIVLFL